MGRKSIAIAVLFVASRMAGLASAQEPPHLPHYEGKQLSDWIAASKDQDPNVRTNANRVLVDVAVPDLVQKTRSRERGVRWDAVIDLGRIGPRAHVAIPAVTFLLDDTEPNVRVNAAIALKKIDPATKAAAPVLIKALAIPDTSLRCIVSVAFFEDSFGEDAAQTILDAVSDLDEEGRRWASGCLAGIGKPALPRLTKALDDRNQHVRAAAVYALQLIQEFSEDSELRKDATNVLRQFKK